MYEKNDEFVEFIQQHVEDISYFAGPFIRQHRMIWAMSKWYPEEYQKLLDALQSGDLERVREVTNGYFMDAVLEAYTDGPMTYKHDWVMQDLSDGVEEWIDKLEERLFEYVTNVPISEFTVDPVLSDGDDTEDETCGDCPYLNGCTQPLAEEYRKAHQSDVAKGDDCE